MLQNPKTILEDTNLALGDKQPAYGRPMYREAEYNSSISSYCTKAGCFPKL